MTPERDPLLEALAAAEVPALPPGLSARTLARAGAHLEPKPSRPAPLRPLAIPIPAFAVPALLASAAIALAVDTCVRVARIFGAS
jgi:hypothetical protein